MFLKSNDVIVVFCFNFIVFCHLFVTFFSLVFENIQQKIWQIVTYCTNNKFNLNLECHLTLKSTTTFGN